MNLLCFIDNLGSGGAQRQLCRLAILLRNRGWTVEMLTYHAGGFFRADLERAGIPYHIIDARPGLSRILALRYILRQRRPDVVLAFLPMPCLYAELVGLLNRRWGLVVGERSATHGAVRRRDRLQRMFHRFADAIVTNSHANRLILERSVPALRGRVSTIYNALDFDEFHPAPWPDRTDRSLEIVVAASYRPLKNLTGWIEAARIARDRRPELLIRTNWFGAGGSPTDPNEYAAEARRRIVSYNLEDRVVLNGPVQGIAERYGAAHAVALPSLIEGLPNTICEAMACARPVAAGAISDAGALVSEGVNGYLFDPEVPEEMATAMTDLASIDSGALEAMGREGYRRARELLEPHTIADRYADTLARAAARERSLPVHWPPDVPDTAVRTADAAFGIRR